MGHNHKGTTLEPLGRLLNGIRFSFGVSGLLSGLLSFYHEAQNVQTFFSQGLLNSLVKIPADSCATYL